MRRTVLPLVLVLLLILSGFKTQDTPDAVKDKVKTITDFLAGTHIDYSYDDEGRFVSVLKPNIGTLTQTYLGNFIYINGTDPTGRVHQDTIQLNLQGKIEKYYAPEYFIEYYYNEQGQCIKEIEFDYRKRKPPYKYTSLYNFEQGNLVSTLYIDEVKRKGKPQKPYTVYYDYYDKPNAFKCSSFGMSYSGHCSNKLVSKKVGVTAKGDTNFYFNYRYEFDDKGRVVKEMCYYRTGQLQDSVGFTYY